MATRRRRTNPDAPTPPQRPRRQQVFNRTLQLQIAESIVGHLKTGRSEAIVKELEDLGPLEAAHVAVAVYQRSWPDGLRASFLQLLARAAGC